jgi:putative Mg2+ transporter-C (MgtC) family protein
MPLNPSWEDITLRLVLAAVAGGLVGFNRESHSRAAGLRTTILICVAAALAMALANRLIVMEGKTDSSFVQLDMMRLPLGILSGIGFIGAGAVIKRDDVVVGVTTAATLWFMTVVGLCLGAGELALGMGATLAAIVVLWGLGRLELILPRKIRASLKVTSSASALPEPELRKLLTAHGYEVQAWTATRLAGDDGYSAELQLSWKGRLKDGAGAPPLVDEVMARGATRAEWSPKAV